MDHDQPGVFWAPECAGEPQVTCSAMTDQFAGIGILFDCLECRAGSAGDGKTNTHVNNLCTVHMFIT